MSQVVKYCLLSMLILVRVENLLHRSVFLPDKKVRLTCNLIRILITAIFLSKLISFVSKLFRVVL